MGRRDRETFRAPIPATMAQVDNRVETTAPLSPQVQAVEVPTAVTISRRTTPVATPRGCPPEGLETETDPLLQLPAPRQVIPVRQAPVRTTMLRERSRPGMPSAAV